MSNFEDELSVAIAAVQEAAKVCQSVQSGITPDALEKKDRSPVTVADFASQAVICRLLREAFPNDPVIGEEDAAELKGENAGFLDRIGSELSQIGVNGTSDDICSWIDRGSAKEYSSRFWTLDPIDGTKGFLRGEQYAIALALIVEGRISVALLGCPNLPIDGPPNADRASGTLCIAVAGQGSETAALDDTASRKSAAVTTSADGSSARFCESVESGHSSHGHSAQIADQLGITQEPVRLDSQAKYAIVGRGDADIYLRLPTRKDYTEKIWDHAGGALFVQEAGGRITDINGRDLEFHHGYQLTANRGVVATNGPLHDAVLTAIRDVGVE